MTAFRASIERMFFTLVLVGFASTSPAFAREDPAPDQATDPDAEASVVDDEADERRLRLALVAADDAWEAPAAELATWLEARWRY